MTLQQHYQAARNNTHTHTHAVPLVELTAVCGWWGQCAATLPAPDAIAARQHGASLFLLRHCSCCVSNTMHTHKCVDTPVPAVTGRHCCATAANASLTAFSAFAVSCLLDAMPVNTCRKQHAAHVHSCSARCTAGKHTCRSHANKAMRLKSWKGVSLVNISQQNPLNVGLWLAVLHLLLQQNYSLLWQLPAASTSCTILSMLPLTQ
jgi:hypothetical protein